MYQKNNPLIYGEWIIFCETYISPSPHPESKFGYNSEGAKPLSR